jgi:hypothetical protein
MGAFFNPPTNLDYLDPNKPPVSTWTQVSKKQL